jgi:hypothetical protein
VFEFYIFPTHGAKTMSETSKRFTDRLEDLMLNSFEPMTEESALEWARWEGVTNEMTNNDVFAALARAKFSVLGSLVANEYETPDSDRMLDEGHTRERAIEHWIKLFTQDN